MMIYLESLLPPDTVAKAVAIDDDECNHECSYSPGKSCGGPYGVVNVYRHELFQFKHLY